MTSGVGHGGAIHFERQSLDNVYWFGQDNSIGLEDTSSFPGLLLGITPVLMRHRNFTTVNLVL